MSRVSASRARLPSPLFETTLSAFTSDDGLDDEVRVGRPEAPQPLRPPVASAANTTEVAAQQHAPPQSDVASLLPAGGPLPPPTGSSIFHRRTPLLPFPVSASSARKELMHLLRSAWPVITSNSLTNLLTVVDMIFVGQWFGLDGMAAAALANAYCNLVCVIISGASEAVERDCETFKAMALQEERRKRHYSSTAAGIGGGGEAEPPATLSGASAALPAAATQAIPNFKGDDSVRGASSAAHPIIESSTEQQQPSTSTADQPSTPSSIIATNSPPAHTTLAQRTSALAHRGVFVSLVLCLPAMVALSLAGSMLRGAFLQPSDWASSAASFSDSLILGMLPLAAASPLARWLVSVGHVSTTLLVAAFSNVLNVGVNALLVDVQGFMGAPLATSACRLLQLAMLLGYVFWRWRSGGGSTEGNAMEQCGERVENALASDGDQPKIQATADTQMAPSLDAGGSATSAAAAIGRATSKRAARNEEESVGLLALQQGAGVDRGGAVVAPPTRPLPSGRGLHEDTSVTSSDLGLASVSSTAETASISIAPPSAAATVALPHLPLSPSPPFRHFLDVSFEALGNLSALAVTLRASLTCCAQLAAEVWPYELITLIVGVRGDAAALGAHVVLQYLSTSAVVGLPMGLAAAGRSRIADSLATGTPRNAFQTMAVAACASVSYTLSCAMATLSMRGALGSVFAESDELAAEVAALVKVAVAYQTIDGFQTVLGGLLRSVSEKHEARITLINVLSWWLVGLPLAIILTLDAGDSLGFGVGWGVVGAWYAMVAVVAINAIAYGIIFHQIDWVVSARQARSPAALREGHTPW